MRSRWIQRAWRSSLVMAAAVLATSRGSSRAAAPRDFFQAIDHYVLQQMVALKIPGAAIGIVRGNDAVYVKGYGVADETGRAMTIDTPFLIASLSKSITAVAVMQLVEAGKVELDAPVQVYLPWFTAADAEASSRITIHDLLHHTSGFSEIDGYKRNLNTDAAPDALEQSIRSLHNAALSSPPGHVFEYSNTNYDILGLVIEAVSGQAYEQYVEEAIFAPLDMQDSYADLEEARAAGMTRGFYPLFGVTTAYDHLMPYSRITKPSAGLFSSAEDLTHYVIAQLNQGSFEESRILTPEGIAQLQTAGAGVGKDVGYAKGLIRFRFSDMAAATHDGTAPTALAHAGEWVGYTSLLVFMPELDTGLVVLLNKSDPSRMPEFFHLGWSLAMLSVGLEPVPAPQADFVTRYARGILLAAVALLTTSLVWSVRRLRGLDSHQVLGYRRQRALVLQVALLFVVDLILAGVLLLIQLPQNNDTLANLVREKPDLGLLCVWLLVLTLGWGPLRTALFVNKIPKRRARSVVS